MSKPPTWTLDDLLRATGGQLLSGEREVGFAGISIDSRRISPTDLFVAIQGAAHDGHRFAADVIRQGVRGILIAHSQATELSRKLKAHPAVVCIAVEDTTRALGALAAFHRRRCPVSVVAITGSNGKTTTKELTAAVVARGYPTLASRGNFNNEIGVPLSLFTIDTTYRWAVMELGMNHPGEIDRLARICRPDIGVITNIGPVHLEGLGSMEAIMAAKGELLAHLPPGGVAVLNADDPRVLRIERPKTITPLLFGLSPAAQIQARAVHFEGMATAFTLVLPGASLPVQIHAPGKFMVSNALAAAAVGHVLGLAGREIKAGLENFRPIGGRMLLLPTRRGIHIIDDSYNANPVSMKAAAETLAVLRQGRPGHLVCGDMLELGESAVALHHSLGGHIARFGFEGLYATGRFTAALADGAVAAGMAAERIFTGSQAVLLQALTQRLHSGDWVLVKGSRGMAMERLVKNLKQWADT